MRNVMWSRALTSSIINRNDAFRHAYVDRLQRLSLNNFSAYFIANSQSALKLMHHSHQPPLLLITINV